MNFAIIPAAGPIVLDKREGRTFPKPRALLSLGEETVIQRLVRQAKNAGFEVLVGINDVGEGGWTADHIREFEQLDCQLYTSPTRGSKRGIQTVVYLLKKALQDPDLDDHSTILDLHGDWIYSETLFEEVLSYRRPCLFAFQPIDWGFAIEGKHILPFLDVLEGFQSDPRFFRRHMEPYMNGDPAPNSNYRLDVGPLGQIGFEIYKRYDYWPKRFVEIDWMSEYETALDLVAEERGKRRVFVTGCWDLFHVGHLRRLEGAKREGDYLLVGVSTDEFMRRHKGEPVIPLAQRIEIVSRLKCVDFVIPHADLESEIPFHDFRCNVRVTGEEWGFLPELHARCTEMMKRLGIEIVTRPRTPDISTVIIKERVYHEALANPLDSVMHPLGVRGPEETTDVRGDPKRR